MFVKEFIELLRRGVENRDSAIKCLRTSLAPCALDAYPVVSLSFGFISYSSITVNVILSR